MNLKEMRAAALKAAQDTLSAAKAAERELSEGERDLVEAKFAEIEELDKKIAGAKEHDVYRERLAGLDTQQGDPEDQHAKSLGDHFVKSLRDGDLSRLKSVGGFTVATPEFKAATDTHAIPAAFSPLLTEVDRNVVRAFRRPVVSDLFGTGTLSGNAVTYFVEGAVEGSFGTVAPGGQKPQIHVADPSARTDALKKIAAWFDTQDEMIEDVPFWVSEINNRGLYLLSLAEENQLLNGDGTGANIAGLLGRSGVQTETQGATGDTAADAIFRAMTKVQTATGLAPDAVIINPADYQGLRLAKDANEQYYGGGFFAGAYGNDGLQWQPGVWGLNTVVSAAVPAKTVVVGALKAAATVYRKGGVRVESTNSDQGKFTTNVVTTRIEERLTLAVRVPAAVVKVTLV